MQPSPEASDPSDTDNQISQLEKGLIVAVCLLFVLVALLALTLVGAIWRYRRRLRNKETKEGLPVDGPTQ